MLVILGSNSIKFSATPLPCLDSRRVLAAWIRIHWIHRLFSNSILTVLQSHPHLALEAVPIKNEMKIALIASRMWILTNILGIGIYLAIEYWILFRPREIIGDEDGIGDVYLWITRELPILVAFLLINVIWLKAIWTNSLHPNRRSQLGIWLLMCLVWGCALIYQGTAVIMLKVLFTR